MLKSFIIYGLTFFISILFSVFFQKEIGTIKKKEKNIRKHIFFLCTLALPIFIASLRYGIGTDYFSYELIYHQISQSGFANVLKFSTEPLFSLLNYIGFVMFPSSSWGVFFLFSLATNFFFFKGITYYKNDLQLPMAWAIYLFVFYLMSFNIMRQMIATAIIFNSFKYIIERKPLKYVCWVIVASLFHNSAIICLLFYFISFKKSKWKIWKQFGYYLTITIGSLLLYPLLSVISNIPILNTYFKRYNIEFMGISLTSIIDIIPIIIPIILFRKNNVLNNNKFILLYDLSLLMIPLTIFSYFTEWGFRLKFYISIIQIITVPLAISGLSKKENKITFGILFSLLYVSYFVFKFVILKNDEVFPFKSFISIFN